MGKLTDLRIRDERRFPACWIPLPVFSRKLSSTALLTYTGLAYYAGSSGECQVSLRELAATIGMAVRTTQYGLRELEQKKLIRVEEQFRKANKHRPEGQREQLANDYILLELNEKPVPI